MDGSTVGDIGDAELSDRKILGADGFISVVVVVNLHSMSLVSGPDIHARGFVEDDSVERGPGADHQGGDGRDGRRFRGRPRPAAGGAATVGRWVNNTYRRRPMILPVVVSA